MIGRQSSEAQQSLYSRLREMQSETAAERVSRPAREKKRRLRVLVMETRSSSPMRAVHRASLLAITCADNQAAVAAKRPGGRRFRPTPYFRSRMAFSTWARRR